MNLTPHFADASVDANASAKPVPTRDELQALSGRDVAGLGAAEREVLDYFLARSSFNGVFVIVVNLAPASEVRSARASGNPEALPLLQASYPNIVVTSLKQFCEVKLSLGFLVLFDEDRSFEDEYSSLGFLSHVSETLSSVQPGRAGALSRKELQASRRAGLASLSGRRRSGRWA